MADKNPTAPRGHSVSKGWPSFRYGPDGEAEVFHKPEDVPEGWSDTPETFKPKPAPKAGLQKPQNVQPELTKTLVRKPKAPWPEPKGDE